MSAMAGVVVRRVVAEHDHLDALQAHDAVGLGPAAVVADAHAHRRRRSRARRGSRGRPARNSASPDAGTARPGCGSAWPGRCILRYLPTMLPSRSTRIDGVEAALAAALDGQLGIAEIEADAELLGLVEQRLRLAARHLALVIGVELGLVLDQPVREEGGERELGEDDESAPLPLASRISAISRAHGILAGLRLGDRPHLGGCGLDDPAMACSFTRCRLRAAR